jgi:hypothetical protein
MASLTRAELAHYPGIGPTEQAFAAHAEHRNDHLTPLVPSVVTPDAVRPRPLPRKIDLRPFPGRTRLERAKCYLVAHFVRAESWSDEALTAMAKELLRTSEIVR